MLEHLNISPLLSRLRVYDRGFQYLVAQAEELNRRIAESEGQKAALETQIAEAEHQLRRPSPAKKGSHARSAPRKKSFRSEAWAAKVSLTTISLPAASRPPQACLARRGAEERFDLVDEDADAASRLAADIACRPRGTAASRRSTCGACWSFPIVDLFSIQQHCRFSGPRATSSRNSASR